MIEVTSDIAANVWKVLVAEGQAVAEGETLAILEAMKTEIPVEAPAAGRVARIAVAEGSTVGEGQLIAEIAAG